jgi:putative DNA primase/helicase
MARISSAQIKNVAIRSGIDERFLTGKNTPCPAPGCGGRDRFRFTNFRGKGEWLCTHCGAGNLFTLIKLVHGCSFPAALKKVSDALGGFQAPIVREFTLEQSPDKIDWQQHEKMLGLWESAYPASLNDPAGRYLVNVRGLKLTQIPRCLRFAPKAWTFVDGTPSPLPAMLARFDAPNGEMAGLHRTFLTNNGQKAQIEKPKKFLKTFKQGALVGGAVRLFEPSEVLGIAEGIETSLAAHLLFDIPVWATCSALLMSKVVITAGVRKVVIFADNDSHKDNAGVEAAQALAKRLKYQGFEVQIKMPADVGWDFLDVYTKNQGFSDAKC